jgi:hypothetical protein
VEPKVDPKPDVKEPWWKWIVEDPKKATRVLFFALALLGWDQWAASRVAEVKGTVDNAVKQADTNAKVVDDLFNVVTDVKTLVCEVKADNQVMLKAVNPNAGCGCENCPAKK